MASSVTSAPVAMVQFAATASSTAPTVAGCISDGVPPPRNTLVTSRWPGALPHRRKLGREGCREALLIDRLMADMAVEVAIGAFGRAEWPMDVDAKARFALAHAEPSLARANFWKARARCDSASAASGFQPCFSAAVISPKVLS